MVLLAKFAITQAFPQETERPAISDEQLETTLQDKRYLMRQLKCALGEAPCDPVGRRLKSKFFYKLFGLRQNNYHTPIIIFGYLTFCGGN